MLLQTLKFAMGQVPPKTPEEGPRYNKYAMVAADILSSEAKKVIAFFMTESIKPNAETSEPKQSEETAPKKSIIETQMATDQLAQFDGKGSSDDLTKGSEGKEKHKDEKPDLFVIEGTVIRKSPSS